MTPEVQAASGHKTCTKCGRLAPLSGFYRNRGRRFGAREDRAKKADERWKKAMILAGQNWEQAVGLRATLARVEALRGHGLIHPDELEAALRGTK